jgi:hypothetical protein
MAEYPQGQNRRENRIHFAVFDIGALVESELDQAIAIHYISRRVKEKYSARVFLDSALINP